jgi:multiple sugar transport system substrate-binding protein
MSRGRTSRAAAWRLVLLLAVAAGCGGGGGEGEKIVFWQFWPLDTINPLVEQFEAENPGLEVVVEQLTWQSGQEKITAAVASGKPPDLVELGSTWFPAYAHQGILADWTERTGEMRAEFRLWEMCEAQGRVFGLPWLAGTRALFYNKTLFAEAGLDSSRAPGTWNELLGACKKIDGLGEDISGYGANAGERYILFKKYMPYAWSNGGGILSEDLTRQIFDSSANVEALRFYLALAEAGRIDQQAQLDQAFKEGKIGCTLTGSWLLAQIPAGAPELRYGVALVPTPEGKESRSFAGGEILSSFARSQNQEGAWKLAAFLMRPENTLAIARAKKSVQPTSVAALGDEYFENHPHERVFLEQLALSVPTPNHPEWLMMESMIEAAVENAIYDKLTPEQAIAGAAEEIEEILDEAGGNQ